MNKWFELLLGLVLIAGAIYAWGMNLYGFGDSALTFLKGGIVWFVIMIALLLIMLGITDIKDN
jgi:C4-dicarboxylate transporter